MGQPSSSADTFHYRTHTQALHKQRILRQESKIKSKTNAMITEVTNVPSDSFYFFDRKDIICKIFIYMYSQTISMHRQH